MKQPTIFIGSTGEAQHLAITLQSAIDRWASVRVWSQGVFEQNRANLDNLLKVAADFDFACILATPDDFTESRGKASDAPRDNIIFEFGLFLGALGRDRVFFIYPREVQLKLPTDLSGVSFLEYKPPDENNPPDSVLAPVANAILAIVRREGVRKRAVLHRYEPILGHGDIDRVANLTDAALHFSQHRFGHREEIRQHILHGDVIPERYHYFTEEGAEFWLRLSSDPQYRFHSNSMLLVHRIASRFARHIARISDNREDIDFVSMGSGDGEKDRILLDALITSGFRALNYYPIDISDKLLVECIRNVFRDNYDHRGVHTKAVIGDFCNLPVLRAVYEDRPSPNVFSILGNTLGNSDEPKILSALKQSMYPGDFAVIEINCALDEISSGRSILNSPLVIEYACLPLRIAGLEVNVEKAMVHEVPLLSVLRSARSVRTAYSEVEIDGRTVRQVPLTHDHRYHFNSFGDEIKTYLEAEIIDSEVVDNAGALLIRKT